VRENAAAADPLTRTYAARISLDAAAPVQAELGQSARVKATHADASLSIPLTAVQPGVSAEGGTDVQQHSVWVVGADGRVRAQPVRIGAYAEGRVPVLSGLGADDWVVAAGGHLLQDGQQVSALDRRNRPLQGD